jgi:hypothetical protein
MNALEARFTTETLKAENSPKKWPTIGLETEFPRNREINREFFTFGLAIAEFCPKCANFVLKQGISREFCGYLAKSAPILGINACNEGFRKLTGN